MNDSTSEHPASPQPFCNGFPGAAVLDRLCGSPLPAEAAPVGWRRASMREEGGSSLRPGETAGMFAPDTEGSAPFVFGPLPGVTAKATAADRMSTSRTAADQRSTPHTAADRMSAPQDGDYTPQTTPPGVTNLTDFNRLVTQTRVPFPDQATDPSCYGGGVSGSGDVVADGTGKGDNFAAFECFWLGGVWLVFSRQFARKGA